MKTKDIFTSRISVLYFGIAQMLVLIIIVLFSWHFHGTDNVNGGADEVRTSSKIIIYLLLWTWSFSIVYVLAGRSKCSKLFHNFQTL